jgi:predicted HTH transcriptional regulator
MQNSNCNNRNPFGKIFTLLAFFVGVVLYIIIRQGREDKPNQEKEKLSLKVKPKALPKKVNKISKIKDDIEAIELTERQKKIVKELVEKGKIYPSQLQELLPDVSSRTIRRDMNALEKKGLVKQKGTTKSTYYVYIGK